MHLQACRILQIIGLESDLYSKIKGQFGAHDFGAKHHSRDLLLTHSCTILTLYLSFYGVTRLAVSTVIVAREKKKPYWRNMWNSSRSTVGREMCMGIVLGHQPPDSLSDVTCVLQFKSSMCSTQKV